MTTAKIKPKDLEALGEKFCDLSGDGGLAVSATSDSDEARRKFEKAEAFDAGYRCGFVTGLAALAQAAIDHAEGSEFCGIDYERIYERLEKLDLLDYLDESDKE